VVSNLYQVKGEKVPSRSKEQYITELKHANQVRIERAQLKRDIEAGRRKVSEVLREGDRNYRNMRLVELLKALPYYGESRVRSLLRESGVFYDKTVGELETGEISRIAKVLRGR